MTGALLFFKNRRTLAVLTGTAITSALILVVGTLVVAVNPDSRISIPAALLAPIVPAVLIAATTGMPVHAERSASRRMLGWRAVHFVGLTALAMALLAAASPNSSEQAEMIVRNTAGFTGMTLIAGSVPSLAAVSWITPIVWVVIPQFAFGRLSDDKMGIWTFFAQPIAVHNASTFATLVLVVGLALAIAPISSRRGGH